MFDLFLMAVAFDSFIALIVTEAMSDRTNLAYEKHILIGDELNWDKIEKELNYEKLG